jgi:hypothetical protein
MRSGQADFHASTIGAVSHFSSLLILNPKGKQFEGLESCNSPCDRKGIKCMRRVITVESFLSALPATVALNLFLTIDPDRVLLLVGVA